MSLTKQDLSDIRGVVLDALDVAVNPRLDALEEGMDELKQDVTVLKQDVSVLKQDVTELKSDMREVKTSLNSLEGKVTALEADVKEIYAMLADMQKSSPEDKRLKKLSVNQKILEAYELVLSAAKEAGVKLPERP